MISNEPFALRFRVHVPGWGEVSQTFGMTLNPLSKLKFMTPGFRYQGGTTCKLVICIVNVLQVQQKIFTAGSRLQTDRLYNHNEQYEIYNPWCRVQAAGWDLSDYMFKTQCMLEVHVRKSYFKLYCHKHFSIFQQNDILQKPVKCFFSKEKFIGYC